MKIHDRAWEGFKVVILSNEPMSAMRIEQAIAAAAPAVEVQLSSFESYDEAFHYCKEQKDVGFFFLHEKCGEQSFSNVFRELAKQSQGHGIPAFATILYDGVENAFNEKLVGKNANFLDYVDTVEVLDPEKTAPFLERTWGQLEVAFEDQVFSRNLQASLSASAEAVLGSAGLHFSLRLTNNLLGNANVTWLENLATKWSLVLSTVQESMPVVLKPHPVLQYFIEMCKVEISLNEENLQTFLQSKTSICGKIAVITAYLNEHRKQGTLDQQLDLISSWNRPGGAVLIRQIAKNKSRIISFQESVADVVAFGGSHG